MFVSTLFCGTSKGFMMAFVIKREAPQRNVKIKVVFPSSSGIGKGSFKEGNRESLFIILRHSFSKL